MTDDEYTITRAEFARRVGVSRSAVTQAWKAGRFSTAAIAGRLLRMPYARRDWWENRDVRGEPHLEIAKNSSRQLPAKKRAVSSGDSANAVNDEKARYLRIKAEAALLDLEVSRGTMVSREMVVRQLQELAAKQVTLIESASAWATDLAAFPQGDVIGRRAFLELRVNDLRSAFRELLENWWVVEAIDS